MGKSKQTDAAFQKCINPDCAAEFDCGQRPRQVDPCPLLFKYDAGFTKSHGNDLWTLAKPRAKARFSFCFKYVAS